MNAVEIEEAISELAEQPFDAGEFPFAFLQAFGKKETTLKRLRKGESNGSDLGGVLQTNNIHIAVARRTTRCRKRGVERDVCYVRCSAVAFHFGCLTAAFNLDFHYLRPTRN